MFDIGFTELVLCLVIALVVIGPEQLPGTVRTIGLWIGRLKRSLRETRSEIERQIGADDIRRQLHNEDIMRSLEQTRQAMENTIQGEATDASPRKTYGPAEELPDHAHMADTTTETHAETSTENASDTATTTSPASPDTPADSTKS